MGEIHRMKHEGIYSHNCGCDRVKLSGMYGDIISLLDVPYLIVAPGMTSNINGHIKDGLISNGWAMDTKVHPAYNLRVNAAKNNVALTAQTGNIARAFYDLMKFQVLFTEGRINVAVLILPSHSAATNLGSNVANFNRVTNEMPLFQNIITIPCLILSFS